MVERSTCTVEQHHDDDDDDSTTYELMGQPDREVLFDDEGEWCQFDELCGNDSESALGGPRGRLLAPAPQQQQQQQSFSSANNELFLVDVLPPQLHPAVSAGMHRVTSCYFSLGGSCSEASNSVTDLYSLLGDESDYAEATSESVVAESRMITTANNNNNSNHNGKNGQDLNAADLLYHDIIMHVFTFLDAKSLASFSETARRPNFECFYFLQLQLQRALLEDNLLHSSCRARSNSHSSDSNDDPLSAIAGSACISRLASLDKQEAKDTVQEYLDSNSTLRTMPLSHSLAYIRQLLRKHAPADASSPAALTSAAFLITLIGAATVMTGNVESAADSFGTELPNMLFKVGFVGSIMGAASRMREHGTEASPAQGLNNTTHTDGTQANVTTTTTTKAQTEKIDQHYNTISMREAAEHLARTMQGLPSQILQHMQARTAVNPKAPTAKAELSSNTSIPQRMYEALVAASQHLPKPAPPPGLDDEDEDDDYNNNKGAVTQLEEHAILEDRDEAAESEMDTESLSKNPKNPRTIAIHQQFTPNPYEHLPAQAGDNPAIDDNHLLAVAAADTTTKEVGTRHRGKTDKDATLDTGLSSVTTCDTAAPRKMASGCVGAYFRAIRRATSSITRIIKARRVANFEALPDKQQVAQAFIDACCSDESLPIVIDMVQKRGIVDVEGFHVGSDGTETCALHASAFHGATEVLKFLCGGIHERDGSQDQGLCSVNLKDSNGWTAVHFAAGANSVDAVRILAEHGADLAVEATNGYTPLQWAIRLCNDEVAAELRARLEPDHHLAAWISASQPLSMIAYRFFAMIPTH